MTAYHKINSVYKRSPDGKTMLFGEYSTPEIEYLAGNPWEWTEKVDGTNIRLYNDGRIEGRTDNAQIPTFLYNALRPIADELVAAFPEEKHGQVIVYGEGYGAKIQKGGGNYLPDRCGFVAFDVFIDGWWLLRDDVEDVANDIGVFVVPVIGEGTLAEACALVQGGLQSTWGPFVAEGLVMRPAVPMFDRRGRRVITKIKAKDFK